MNVSVELSNNDMLKNRLIEELDNLTRDQLEKLQMLLVDWRNDKRDHAREVQTFVDVVYWDDEKMLNGFIRDLSSEGGFITPAGPFSLGQHITIKFYHPSVTGPIEIDAEIVRREKHGIGVKFSKKIKELG